jgi:UPF0755 protein
MSRHSAPGTDGAFGDDAWLPGGSSAGPADDAPRGGRQRARHAADPHYLPGEPAAPPPGDDGQTGPPWDQPGWDDTGSSLTGPGSAGMAGRHPSEPLPSLPPPPLQEGDWAELPQAFEYASEAGHQPGYHGTGYPGDDTDTDADVGYVGDRPDDSGYGYAGYHGTGYDTGTYPEADYHPGYDDTGTGFPATNGEFPEATGEFSGATGEFPRANGRFPEAAGGFPAATGGFPGATGEFPGAHGEFPEATGGFPAATGGFPGATGEFPGAHGEFPGATGEFPAATGGFTDTGTGYAGPAYAGGRFTDGAGHYPDGAGHYPDGAGHYPDDADYPAGDEYLRYGEPTAGPADRGYPDREGWYEDTGTHSGWAEGDDSGFLPGLGGGTPDSDHSLPDERQADGRRGGARPGKQGTGRSGPGKSGPGKGRPGTGKSGTGGGGKRKSGMRRLAPWLALSVVLALLIGAGAGYFYVYRTYLHPPDFAGPGTTVRVVRIFPGDTASVVGQRLQQEGVVASARAFSNAAKASGQGSSLEPGYYRVRLHMNAALAFALLLKPSSREQTRVTIPEGWRQSQIIAALGRETGNLKGYQKAIKNAAALNLPSFAHGHAEGYLFPATYDVQPNTPPLKVLQDMVTRFDQEAASIGLPAAAAHAELTQSDVIIVASLIQAEGRRAADFPKIARVIYNRLNSNPQIKLQLDSTVMYALHKYGIIANAQQIKVKSRYNTYLHTGLPPTPIDSPGTAAINAALHPAHGNWMYFVTVDPKTGVTKFTSSFTQFEQFRAELESNIAKGK